MDNKQEIIVEVNETLQMKDNEVVKPQVVEVKITEGLKMAG